MPAYHVQLLISKARVTPVNGCTAPRSELNGLLVLTRVLKVVVPVLWESPLSVTIVGDSQCTIAALEKPGSFMAPYFANRISEVTRNISDVKEFVDVGPVYHVPGSLNPADIPTRKSSTAADLSTGSHWMARPPFLYQE